MLKLSKLQQYLLSALASIVFFLIALAVLAISLISANQQAVGIKVIF
ncbi:MAG: hypothetical protein NTZ93_04045 [Candidatus Beckwithbacteria bacterium]|nr:hypothetical protein [Candidatus Beckwithbacteria bacterium]